jgi:hypothetical protein
MYHLIKKSVREQLEGDGEKPFSNKEIKLFKYLNKNKKKYPTKDKLLGFIKDMMPFIGRPKSDARFYYEVYTANYRPEGDYENIDKTTLKDFRGFKQRKTPNNTAYEYSSSKIPFKGSNLEGYWDVNYNNEWYYVVKSYDWYPIYLFINNTWFKVSDSYSSSTAKHLSGSNPVRYNSGLKADVHYVTRHEMESLIRGNSFDNIKRDRVTQFSGKESKSIVGVNRTITIGWGDNRKKVNFNITNVEEEDGKVKIYVTIKKAGKVEGVNRMVVDPDGYEVPSQFSEDIENGIEERVIRDNSNYLDFENTEFVFEHPNK